MVEIESSVPSGHCLDGRMRDIATPVGDVAAWKRKRDEWDAAIPWRFTTLDARRNLYRLYRASSR